MRLLDVWVVVLILIALMGCARPEDSFYSRPFVEAPVNVSETELRFAVSSVIDETLSYQPIDIIWVIDNSGSMQSHQNNLKSNASRFMSSFTSQQGLDWAMGVLSSDSNDLPYLGFTTSDRLNSASVNPVSQYNGAINRLGINGSGTEKFYEPVQRAINNYPSFLRTGAKLALISVTDAKEQSSLSSQNFMNYLAGKKGSSSDVLFYGALGPQDMGCPQTDDFWNFAGSKFEQFKNLTNGSVFKLCSPTFGDELLRLTQDIVTRTVTSRINLTKNPDPKTLKVIYKGQVLPQGLQADGGVWIYDAAANAILVHNPSVFYDRSDDVIVRFVEIP